MAINAINGITVSTSSTINGVSGLSAVNGESLSGGGGAFPDLTPYGTLVQLLVADDAPSGSVATWPAAEGSDATQSTSGSRPTRVDSDLNGHHTLDFDGDDWMEHGDVFGATVFIVFLSTTGNQAYAYIIGEAITVPFHGGDTTVQFANFAAPGDFSSGTVYVDGVPNTWTVPSKPTSFQLFTCKAALTGATLNRVATSNGAEVALPGRVWDGKIACLAYFSDILNDANREAVEDLIGAYYGITITH